MDNESWTKIASRVVVEQAFFIDSIIREKECRETGKVICRYRDLGRLPRMPSAANWKRKETDTVAVGIRVAKIPRNVAQIASRLATLGLERRIVPIILSTTEYSGFEQFGFRVECLIGRDAAQLTNCEEELKRFWGIELVLDTDVILAMR